MTTKKRMRQVRVLSGNDPFRTMKGSGKEPGAAPGIASKARQSPEATEHAQWSRDADGDRTYGGAGVLGVERDNEERHEGPRRSIEGRDAGERDEPRESIEGRSSAPYEPVEGRHSHP